MLKIGVIGLGNAGNQVAVLANERLNCPAIAINSSDNDLAMVNDKVKKIRISNEAGTSDGSAKNRKVAKSYLKDSIMSIISEDTEFVDMIKNMQVCFVVSSTGGGIGSGTAPILFKILKQQFAKTDVKFILVAITPVMGDKPVSHVNTLEYFKEVYTNLEGATYMVYDNSKYDLSSYILLPKVNEEIVKDMEVISCRFNYSTPYESIDNGDMLRLISFPGRLLVSRIVDIKEKDIDNQSIEDMIINNIKTNAHCETQRNKKIRAAGVITNLSTVLMDTLNDNIPKVTEFVGAPEHNFKHIYINEDRKMANNVFTIYAGLSQINDKIRKITDRIEEIESAKPDDEEENALNDVDVNAMVDGLNADNDKTGEVQTTVNVKGIFEEFDA